MTKTKKTVYEIITEKILDQLKNGTVAWQKPWKGGAAGWPLNRRSKKGYRGINVFILALQNRSSRYWMTYRQAQEKGGNVRKGEKGTTIIFWKVIDKKKKSAHDADEKSFILRYYTVFNLEQIDDVEDPDAVDADADAPINEFAPIEVCEQIVAQMQNAPAITHNEPRAYYRPGADSVNMPKAELFTVADEYYSTMFHELGHSTGHKSRLDRDTLTQLAAFGDSNYSKEELVAEMTAAFLCGHAGIENNTIDNSAAYIKGWMEKIADDPKLVVSAAAQAQKAADYILNI